MKKSFWDRLAFWKNKSHDLYEVFTPNKPAILTFVDRKYLSEQLDRAVRTPGKQVIVYGHSGGGKSTVVQHIAIRHFKKFIASRCATDTTFADLLDDAYDQLNQFYDSEQSEAGSKGMSSSISTKLGPLDISFGTEAGSENGTVKKRLINPVLGTRRLGTYLKAENICWIIEDFHKVDESEKITLTDNLKIFFDLEAKVIAIGAVGTARQVMKINQELFGRVAEIRVPLMLDDELLQLISKGEECLNIEIEPAVKEKIIRYSGGLASICHQLCLNLAEAKNIKETVSEIQLLTDIDFDEAINIYIHSVSDTMKEAYDLAIRLGDNERVPYPKEIIKSFLRMAKDEISLNELEEHLKSLGNPDNKEMIQSYLLEMVSEQRANVLRYDDASNKYAINDRFFIPFAFSRLQTELDEDEILRIKEAGEESSRGLIIDEISPKIQQDSDS